MPPRRKQQVVDLLKSLETKDPVPLAYVNPNNRSLLRQGRV
jgi:hypothetical protein